MATSARPIDLAAAPPPLLVGRPTHRVFRCSLRWALIALLTALAFGDSFVRLAHITIDGGLGSYVSLVPVAALLTGVAIARRPRRELPIHDRQLDLIVGVMGLTLALVTKGVLLPRYSEYFDLLRLDLLAMWVFAASAAIVMFGLRAFGRFAWVWGMLVLVFPLPYYVTVITLGGGKVYAGWATLVVSGVASGIATGRTFRRGLAGSLLSWLIGITVLMVMTVYFTHANLVAFELIPASTAMLAVAVMLYLDARGGHPTTITERSVEPVASAQAWKAAPVVVGFAVALAVIELPAPTIPPTLQFDTLAVRAPVGAPPGWHVTATERYPWARRLYGRNTYLVRQQMVADTGDPAFDEFARPRTVVVDSLSAPRASEFRTYPIGVLYDLADARVSRAQDVDLGFGITGQLSSVFDNDVLVTYNELTWTWRNGARSQQVRVAAVDDHDSSAPFPEPTGGVGPTLNTLVAVLLRGNAAVTHVDPEFKDAGLLTQFARAAVATALRPTTSEPGRPASPSDPATSMLSAATDSP